MNRHLFQIFCLIFWIGLCQIATAAGLYKPFIAGDAAGGTVQGAVATTKKKLEAGGFEIVGSYAPYIDDSAYIIGFTSPGLKKAAGKHLAGGFGAVLRAAVTNNNGVIEISYVNPPYLGFAYQIGGLGKVDLALSNALGAGEPFGAKGFTAKNLGKWHYMIWMPYFKDRKMAGQFSSHNQAITAINKALENPGSHMGKVWQVTINSQQTVFGVKLSGGPWKGQMKNIMAQVDVGSPKSTAALPWEFLVSGNKVYYLPGKFRIALMFPELSMGQFMKISDIPDRMDASADLLIKHAKQ